MSIQDIVAKIVAQAETEAKQKIADAQVQADSIAQDSKKSIEQESQSMKQKTEEKIERAIKKSESLAHMEGKNQVLAKKQELVTSVLQSVIEQLASMPAKDYEQLLASMLNNVDVEEGTIFPSKGKENSTKGAVKIAGKKFKVGNSRDFKGGFIVESDTSDFDFTFESLVFHVLRKDLESIIVADCL